MENLRSFLRRNLVGAYPVLALLLSLIVYDEPLRLDNRTKLTARRASPVMEGARPNAMFNGLMIFLGGGLGSLARWLATDLMTVKLGETFPWGTLAVNVTGSFLIGFVATLTGPEGRFIAPPSFRQFFMIGVCGGYTTFSSFSLRTLNMAQDGEWLKAGANVGLSVILCLVGVWLGHAAALVINTKGN
jgi:CrcB protein